MREKGTRASASPAPESSTATATKAETVKAEPETMIQVLKREEMKTMRNPGVKEPNIRVVTLDRTIQVMSILLGKL